MIIRAAEYASAVPDEPVVRVQPSRRWFGNTRVVGQAQLDKFRAEMQARRADPYSVLLKQSKLPMSLLTDSKKASKSSLLQVENFEYTFGSKSQRKRPKLAVGTMEELAQQASLASSDGEAREYDTRTWPRGQTRGFASNLSKGTIEAHLE